MKVFQKKTLSFEPVFKVLLVGTLEETRYKILHARPVLEARVLPMVGERLEEEDGTVVYGEELSEESGAAARDGAQQQHLWDAGLALPRRFTTTSSSSTTLCIL